MLINLEKSLDAITFYQHPSNYEYLRKVFIITAYFGTHQSTTFFIYSRWNALECSPLLVLFTFGRCSRVSSSNFYAFTWSHSVNCSGVWSIIHELLWFYSVNYLGVLSMSSCPFTRTTVLECSPWILVLSLDQLPWSCPRVFVSSVDCSAVVNESLCPHLVDYPRLLSTISCAFIRSTTLEYCSWIFKSFRSSAVES